jgi:hypothetical protein
MKDLLDEKISEKFFKNYGTIFGVPVSNITRAKTLRKEMMKGKNREGNNFYMKSERGFEMIKTPGAYGKQGS